MNWNQLKHKIYYCDGSLRDIYVLGTNSSDWRKWADYVNENDIIKIKWFNGKIDQSEEKIDFKVVEELWNGNHDFGSTVRIFIDNIQINAHFFDDAEIENDVNPKEINSIHEHIKLMSYMADVSLILDKEVILTPENEQQTVLIRVNKGKIEFV